MMFIIDCTGSMGSWIEACKKEIKSIIDCVRNQHFNIQIRVSIIAYRDHCDGKLISEVFPFSQNIAGCQTFLKDLRATGGGDCPEDVAGGFENALKQSWEGVSKYAILLADAPCHGNKYHSGCGDDYPEGDPKGRIVENQIQQFAAKGIFFNAIKMTSETDKMFQILNQHYEKKMGSKIQFADLGSSTKSFNFFVTQSISRSLSLSQGGSSNGGLMNKLISLSSEGKFSIILSVVEKVSAGQFSKKGEESKSKEAQSSVKTSEEFEKVDISRVAGSTSHFEIITEEVDEDEALEVIDKEEITTSNLDEIRARKLLEDQQNHTEKQILNLEIKSLDHSLAQAKSYNATCHTWFIVKDKGIPINWQKPLLQRSQITSKVVIADSPFSEGAMRYAFLMKDCDLNEEHVVKVPKNINPKSYNLEEMKNDIEAMFICSHMVS